MRPAEAQCISPSSPLPVIDAIVPSVSSAYPGNEFWKLTVLLARKLKDEIPIKKKNLSKMLSADTGTLSCYL